MLCADFFGQSVVILIKPIDDHTATVIDLGAGGMV
jgi:hypothetical protein